MSLEDTPRIERAEVFLVPLRLREAFRSSASVTQDRRIILVALHGEGATGWGECVAQETTGYSPETTETAWYALTRRLLPAVAARAHRDPSEDWALVLAGAGALPDEPMARAAVEMAAWDLSAKRAGRPLCEALGGTVRAAPAGVSVGLEDDEETLLRRIEGFLEEGYRRVKLKIAPGRDVKPLARLRAEFPGAVLSADGNGAYTLADRECFLELDALGLAMLEQPLPPDALPEHARLQSILRMPICLDESIGSVEDAGLALELRSCRVVNLKPGRVGGFGPARAIHDVCRAADVPVWCGGMLESGIGRAHNVALATLPGFTLPGDLSASRRYWERDIVRPEWELSAGALTPLDAPGIGVEPDLVRIMTLAERHQTFE